MPHTVHQHEAANDDFIALLSPNHFSYYSTRRSQLEEFLQNETNTTGLVNAGLPEDFARIWGEATRIDQLASRRRTDHLVVACKVDRLGQQLPDRMYRAVGLVSVRSARWSFKKRPAIIEGFVLSNSMNQGVHPSVSTLLYHTLKNVQDINDGNIQIPVGGGSVERYTSLRHAATLGWHALDLCERDQENLHFVKADRHRICA